MATTRTSEELVEAIDAAAAQADRIPSMWAEISTAASSTVSELDAQAAALVKLSQKLSGDATEAQAALEVENLRDVDLLALREQQAQEESLILSALVSENSCEALTTAQARLDKLITELQEEQIRQLVLAQLGGVDTGEATQEMSLALFETLGIDPERVNDRERVWEALELLSMPQTSHSSILSRFPSLTSS